MKTYASQASKALQILLAKDEGRADRLRAMADRIAEKARRDPRRIQCGETFSDLLDLAKEVQS